MVTEVVQSKVGVMIGCLKQPRGITGDADPPPSYGAQKVVRGRTVVGTRPVVEEQTHTQAAHRAQDLDIGALAGPL